MELKKLFIKNFKGLRSLDVEFGKITKISGRNATGKTSIFDAYIWLLWGKNSEDDKEFGVKPIDKNGEPIHNLDVEVEGVFDAFKLKRILKEKWQRKRGAEIAEFVGNETEYYIDDIKVSANQYIEFISKIADEKRFKMLSNPLYFSQYMDWKERRVIIMETIKQYNLEAIIREKYNIKNENIDKYKLELKQKINAIKSKITEYPIRISELKGQIKERFNIEILNNQIKSLEDKIKEQEAIANSLIEANKAALENYNNELQRLNNLKIKLANEQNKITQENLALEREYQNKLNKYRENLLLKTELENKISKNKHEIEQLNNQLNDLRIKYKEVAALQFNLENENCEVCGQKLPELILLQRKNEGEVKFFENKRKQLQSIELQGQSIKEQMKQIEDFIEVWQKQLNNLDLTEPGKPVMIESNEIIEQLIKQIDDFKLPEKPQIDISSIEQEKSKLYAQIIELKNQVNIEQNNLEVEKRINQLQDEWRENGKELSTLESELINIEKFEIELANAIQEQAVIDKEIKFKMFRQLINGSFEPCCEALINEVTYSDANHAAKITTGLKIIEFLAEKLELPKLPIFIDNAEALNDLPDYDGQMIALFVSIDECLTIKN